MEIDLVKLAAIGYMGVFGITAVMNALNYGATLGYLRQARNELGWEEARKMTNSSLEEMSKKGWLYNNVINIGTRRAREKFLKEIL